MAFCDPLTPVGGGHGCWHCTGYSQSPDNHYIGMFMVQADYGCQVGCKPCKQAKFPDDFMRPGGLRWLKAYMPIDVENNNVLYPNRLADGMVGDLRSIGNQIEEVGEDNFWNTRRVPEHIYFHRGVCWDNRFRKEGFGEGEVGTDACDCSIRPSTSGQFSCNGVPFGDPVLGNFPDDFFYEDIEAASPSGNPFFCRQRPHHDSQVVHVSSGELFSPTILRTNVCSGNLFHFCTTTKWCGEPCFEYGDDPVPLDCVGGHINNGWQAFNFVPIQFNDVRLRKSSESQSFKFTNDPVIDFKNAVLSHLPNLRGRHGEDTFVFGQLDHSGGAIWQRNFGLDEPTIQGVQRGMVPFEFGDCRLKQATYPDRIAGDSKRHLAPVIIEPYIVDAEIKMWLVAQQMLDWREGQNLPSGSTYENAKRTYPQVRMRIRVRVSYIARNGTPDDPNVNNDSWPEIFESWWPEDHDNFEKKTPVYLRNGIGDLFPSVGKPLRYPPLVSSRQDLSGVRYEDALAASVDQILVFDSQGRQFDIPNIVEWWGYVGVYGGQKNYASGAEDQGEPCCKLLRDLDGMKVQGWPYNFSSYNESISNLDVVQMQDDDWIGRGLYGGTVQLNFAQHQNYTSWCG